MNYKIYETNYKIIELLYVYLLSFSFNGIFLTSLPGVFERHTLAWLSWMVKLYEKKTVVVTLW